MWSSSNTVNTGFTVAHSRLSSPSHSPNAKESASLLQRLMTLMKAYRWYAACHRLNLLGVDYVSSVAAFAKAWALSLV
ncbi:hypothetical protein BJV78DRAFT_1197660 [Lactifluus subvellereus]|nr:hypothetical protein BJV78DRAFT_1197660 [Lactifluus subvellereus]